MRAVIFSWEYPPRVVGKLAEYVSSLAAQLAKNSVETYIVTYNDALTGDAQELSGVKITRVANPVHTIAIYCTKAMWQSFSKHRVGPAAFSKRTEIFAIFLAFRDSGQSLYFH